MGLVDSSKLKQVETAGQLERWHSWQEVDSKELTASRELQQLESGQHDASFTALLEHRSPPS